MKHTAFEKRIDFSASISRDTAVLIFGVNSLFDQICLQLNVVGVIYDPSFEKPKLPESFQLFLLGDELINSYPIVVTACGKIITAINLLLNHGHKRVTHILELIEAQVFCFDLPFNTDRDLLDEVDPRCIANQIGFADSLSRDLFIRLFQFRKTYDLNLICDLSDNQTMQYFDPIFSKSLASCERFIDIGGYDGETTAKYLSRFPGGQALIYEPMPENIKKIESLFRGSDQVTILPVGLSNRNMNVKFLVDANRSSSLLAVNNDAASVTVDIKDVRLENLAHGDLFKIDIEGGEIDLLSGLIAKFGVDLPPVSIACYHGCKQFLELPMMFRSLPGSLYFRHYTESIYESVLYYVPANLLLNSEL